MLCSHAEVVERIRFARDDGVDRCGQRGDVAVPAGLFASSDGSIDGVAEVEDLTAQAWRITIEPHTGSDAPTSDITCFAEV